MIQPKSFPYPGWCPPLPSLDLDELMPSDHFLAAEEGFLEEMQAAVGDLPFLDNVGQMNGASFHWEEGEWHWLVKSQPSLHNEIQSLERDRYSDSLGGHDQVSIDSSSREVSSAKGQTPTQVRTSSLKRSAVERDDDLSDDQPPLRKRRCAGDVVHQKRRRESSTTVVSSYQQQIQQPRQTLRRMANKKPQESSQAALPNYQQRIQTRDHMHQSSTTETVPGPISGTENAVNQPKSTRRKGSWKDEEVEKLHELLKKQRAAEKTRMQKPLRDVKLWTRMSKRLKKYYNIERTPNSCKIYWGRYGRERTGFEERIDPPNPDTLATSLQG